MVKEPVDFGPCYICNEGIGRFMVHKDKQIFCVCGGCFMRREDHLRITGEDLLNKPDDSHRAPGSNA